VKRAVEEREGGALAGPGEGGAGGEPVTALDLVRGQRAKRARDFREGEVGEVPRLERAKPSVKSFVGDRPCYISGPQ
jgi:hypothetical protein